MEKDILWNMILREKIPYIFLSLLTENNNSYNKLKNFEEKVEIYLKEFL